MVYVDKTAWVEGMFVSENMMMERKLKLWILIEWDMIT